MRVISIYPNFKNRGGAQDVALQLALKLNKEKPIVLTNTRQDTICMDYREKVVYKSFSYRHVRDLKDKDTVFLSHDRSCTTKLMIWKLLLGKNLHIIHVAHNTFDNLKYFSFFPNKIIAVSNAVKENLINYFRVSESRVRVIFNGMKDVKTSILEVGNINVVKIILPGRICDVKQQIEIVRRTKGKLTHNVYIYFAGVGEDTDKLKAEIGDSKQYVYLGFINMKDCLKDYDYVCLYSLKEGLGMSLIEGLMFGKPLITNDIPAVLDVNKEKETGYVFHTFEELINGLNNLPARDSYEYLCMAEKARKRYEDCFTEEKMIRQYKDIVTEELSIIQHTKTQKQ